MKKEWWQVKTGYSESESEHTIGVFYGHVDEIAFALADQQRGFWCDGKLRFIRAKNPKLPRGAKRDRVNVVIEDVDRKSKGGQDLLEKMIDAFKGRPVEVLDCNLYGAVTLVRT